MESYYIAKTRLQIATPSWSGQGHVDHDALIQYCKDTHITSRIVKGAMILLDKVVTKLYEQYAC